MKDCPPSEELEELKAPDRQEHLGSEAVAVWKKMLVSVCVISAVLVLYYVLITYLDYDGDNGGSIASSDPKDQEDLGPRLSPQLVEEIDTVRHSSEYQLFRTYLPRLLQIAIDHSVLTEAEAE